MAMDPAAERDERVMTLVEQALKTPLRERDSFLQTACQSDPDLYREVSEIVKWEEQMGSFLTRPLVEFIDLDALEQIFKPGETVEGRFEIICRLGDGGMGVVYEAFDNTRKRRIAIKCPKPGYDELLPNELSALDVRHPNVCLVNDIHATKTDLGEVRFLTMEFLDGETLAHKLESGKLEEAGARPIARQLCSGLVEAHRSGILHRDLKPANVILCPQDDDSTRAVITDFGLAVEANEVSALEGGTPNYMAPELWRGDKASQASDVFALGVMLYEMVTGSKPFPALSKQNINFPPPVAPSKLVKNLPRRWDKAILPCLGENPGERCSAKNVLAALEHKPKPAVLVAMAACLILAFRLGIPPVIAYFTPAPIRLAILPVQGSSDLVQLGVSAVDRLPGSIKDMQSGKPTIVSIIPLSKTLKKRVSSLDQVEKVLNATHVLQLTLNHDAGGKVAVEGLVINLKTKEQKPYPADFSEDDLKKIFPASLASAVASALDVPRIVKEETVNPVANAAYTEGRKEFDRAPPDYVHAICAFKEAARLDPASALPLAGLAEAYVRDFDANHGAASKSKATCGADPKAEEAHDSDREEEAKDALAGAEALNADSPRVHLAVGLLHFLIENNPNKALNDYHRVQRISPDNADAWVESGYAYTKEDNYAQAKADYEKAIEISHHLYYKPYEYLGALNFRHGRYSEAVESFEKDKELRPDRVYAYVNLSAAYTKEFKFADALESYREVLKLNESPLMLNNIGVTLAFMGQDEKAIQYYRRALKLNSGYSNCRLNLADALRRTKDPATARTEYQRALGPAKQATIASPDDALELTYRAYLEARLGLKSEAREHIAQAIALHSQYDDIPLWAIETYEALGDRAKALSIAQRTPAQTLEVAARHPNLTGLQQDPDFIRILGQSRQKEKSVNQ